MKEYRIRLAREEDAPGILEIYAPIVRDTAISWEYDPPDESAMRGRIRDKAGHGYPWLVAEDGAGIAGYAYAGRWRDRQAYDWSCESSVYVHPGHRQRGLGRTLYAALFRVLSAQGFRYAVAGIALPNPESIALHESVGMSLAGTHRGVGFKSGEWRDIAFYEIRLGPEGLPSPVIPVLELASREGWEELIGGSGPAGPAPVLR